MNFIDALSWINIRFLLAGLNVTIQVALVSIVLSFIIGAILGIIRYVQLPYISKITGVAVDIIRNLPLLLIIFFTYFALPQIGISLSIFWAAVTAMTIFESAMLSEIIRAGLKSVSKGQVEAGRSTGLTYSQTLFYIIMPQGFKSMIPPIVSQFVALIKDTSLATIISLPEITHNARIVYGQDTSYVIPMFIIMALLYWIVCYVLSKVAKGLEVRLS